MDLSIVIVSFNTRELLRRCLASIFANAPRGAFAVFVVDNASSDDSAMMVEREFAGRVSVIRAPGNLGFSAANNLAIRASTGHHVLALNSDTEVRAGAIERMMSVMEAEPDLGLITCRLSQPDGRLYMNLCHGEHGWALLGYDTLLTDLFWHNGRLIKSLRRSLYLEDEADYSVERRDIASVSGACMMIRRAALEQVGLFDERFFMFFEDPDLCLRLRRGGWKIGYTPAAKVVHIGRASFTPATRRSGFPAIFNRSRVRFYRKERRPLLLLMTRLMVLAGAGFRLFEATWRRLGIGIPPEPVTGGWRETWRDEIPVVRSLL